MRHSSTHSLRVTRRGKCPAYASRSRPDYSYSTTSRWHIAANLTKQLMMDKPPTRRRQHRQALPRSASEPASKLGAVAAGRQNQLSASLPASFAQNDRRHLSDLVNAEEVKGHLRRFPGCQTAAFNFHSCRIPFLSALVAIVAILWFGGAGPIGNIDSSTRKHVAQSRTSSSWDTDSIPESRRISIHNISMPLNLETDNETEARILEEDRRNDVHMRRKHIFWDAEQRDKMIAEQKKAKVLWEKQQMQVQGRNKRPLRRRKGPT